MTFLFFINFLVEVYICYEATIEYFKDFEGDFQEMYLWVFHSCGLFIGIYILHFGNLIRLACCCIEVSLLLFDI